MDELDLMRGFRAEDAEPDATAHSHVAARVQWGIDAAMGAVTPKSSIRQQAPGGVLSAWARVSRFRRVAVVAAAAAIVMAATFGAAQLLRPSPAEASVEFSSSGTWVVATITDPFAAQDELRAAFASRGLDIDVRLVPVSPSMVGTVISMSGSAQKGGAGAIRTLADASQQAPGGPQQIGLRVPGDFEGHADITLGRPAKPGEVYQSAGDAFSPGEVLHASGLKGMRVSDAVTKLEALGLTAVWRARSAAVPDAAATDGAAAVPAEASTPRATQVVTAGPTSPPEGGAVVTGADLHEYGDYSVIDAVSKDQTSVFVFIAPDRSKN